MGETTLARKRSSLASAWPPGVPSTKEADRKRPAFGAGNEIRTHDFNLGKVALYR